MRPPIPEKVEKIDLTTGEVLGWFWAIPVQDVNRKASMKKLAKLFRDEGVSSVSEQLKLTLNLPRDWEPAGGLGFRKPHTLKALSMALATAPSVRQARAWEKRHGTPIYGRQFNEQGVPANPYRVTQMASLDLPSEKDADSKTLSAK